MNLHYLRTKDGVEVDFAITLKERILAIFEVTTSDTSPSKSLNFYRKQTTTHYAYQLVAHLDKKDEFDTPEGLRVRELSSFLADFDLLKLIKS